MKASATYTVKKWEEKPYDDISSDKMTRASVEYALDGEIKGKAAVEYLMFYSHFDAQDQHRPRPSTWDWCAQRCSGREVRKFRDAGYRELNREPRARPCRSSSTPELES
jgi:hypothetical protein